MNRQQKGAGGRTRKDTNFGADRPRERGNNFLPSLIMSPSTISQKKRKNTSPAPGEIPVKKAKRDNDHSKKKTKDKKGKGRESDFHVVQASLVLSIPPKFADDPKTGVNEMLDSMVMRYVFNSNRYIILLISVSL